MRKVFGFGVGLKNVNHFDSIGGCIAADPIYARKDKLALTDIHPLAEAAL
jgi:hypothetical protein